MRSSRAGRRSLRDLLAAVTTVVVDEPTWTALDPERRTLIDVDEPDRHRAADPPIGSTRCRTSRSCSGRSRSCPSATDGRRCRSPTRCPGHDVDWDAERRPVPVGLPARRRRRAGRGTSMRSWCAHPDGLVLVDTGIGHFGRPPLRRDGPDRRRARARSVSPPRTSSTSSARISTPTTRAAVVPSRRHARGSRTPATTCIRTTGRSSRRSAHPATSPGRFAMAALEEDGLLDLDPGDHEVGPGLSRAPRARPHARPSRRVSDGEADDTLLLAGDLLHTPPQVAHPTWPSEPRRGPRASRAEAARDGGSRTR